MNLEEAKKIFCEICKYFKNLEKRYPASPSLRTQVAVRIGLREARDLACAACEYLEERSTFCFNVPDTPTTWTLWNR